MRLSPLPTREVSIHSPRRSEGRRGRGDVIYQTPKSFNPLPPPKRGETRAFDHHHIAFEWFQSTPPAEARGDLTHGRSWGSPRCFNPLPPPKRGETFRILDGLSLPLSFNPLPPPKRGETARSQRFNACPLRVSIHSPRRSEGRRRA